MSSLGVDESMKSEPWDSNYAAVLAYAKENGHLKLPTSNHETRRLAGWLRLQSYRAHIPSCQREKLKVLEPYRDTQSREEKEWKVWIEKFTKLLTFHEANGHFAVPMAADKYLHKWIVYQREREKHGKLLHERRQMLLSIDFKFKCNAKHKEQSFTARQIKEWDAMYEQLVEFHRSHNHCRVPYNYDDNRALGYWVGTQRRDFKKDKVDPGRKDRLDQLGFAVTMEGNSRR
jgi:hypothetical protein